LPIIAGSPVDVGDGAPGGNWEWDESLYSGSARYYVTGRMPYPAALAEALAVELSLDGTGRLLDVGCGPGSLTLVLARLFGGTVGIDADADMIAVAAGRAAEAGLGQIDWRVMRAEQISPELGTFRVVSFAQSFHWVDRPLVARLVRDVLADSGALALVHATTHEGVDGTHPLPFPRPPRGEIADLIRRYLGPARRAGRGSLASGQPPDGQDAVLARAGFTGPVRLEVSAGPPAERDADEIVASVFSLSFAAPHLFGDRKEQFEQDLRSLLHGTSPGGHFCEERRPIALDIWTP
jgi:SAM-dependent methyltransferase